MIFPPKACPACNEPGYNVTSLDDTNFKYLCTSATCPTDVFEGDIIPAWHKKKGLGEFEKIRASYRWQD